MMGEQALGVDIEQGIELLERSSGEASSPDDKSTGSTDFEEDGGKLLLETSSAPVAATPPAWPWRSWVINKLLTLFSNINSFNSIWGLATPLYCADITLPTRSCRCCSKMCTSLHGSFFFLFVVVFFLLNVVFLQGPFVFLLLYVIVYFPFSESSLADQVEHDCVQRHLRFLYCIHQFWSRCYLYVFF